MLHLLNYSGLGSRSLCRYTHVMPWHNLCLYPIIIIDAYPHNLRCVLLNLCHKVIAVLSTVSSPDLLKMCVTLRATDTLDTVYVAAYSSTVHVVIHLMLLPHKLLSYHETTYVVRSQPYNLSRS